ncbi:MAG TPA: hypothetical protein PLU50_05485 [Pseudobdellovibrionaceae bacterium]|nr:hypothetical protein [Pseudobdellovibrionaceae bacterium]
MFSITPRFLFISIFALACLHSPSIVRANDSDKNVPPTCKQTLGTMEPGTETIKEIGRLLWNAQKMCFDTPVSRFKFATMVIFNSPEIARRVLQFQPTTEHFRDEVILRLAGLIRKLNAASTENEKQTAQANFVIFFPEAAFKILRAIPKDSMGYHKGLATTLQIVGLKAPPPDQNFDAKKAQTKILAQLWADLNRISAEGNAQNWQDYLKSSIAKMYERSEDGVLNELGFRELEASLVTSSSKN